MMISNEDLVASKPLYQILIDCDPDAPYLYAPFKVLNTCRLRGQSTKGVKTDIKRQTFRVANLPSAWTSNLEDIPIPDGSRCPYPMGVDAWFPYDWCLTSILTWSPVPGLRCKSADPWGEHIDRYRLFKWLLCSRSPAELPSAETELCPGHCPFIVLDCSFTRNHFCANLRRADCAVVTATAGI